jgi:hypothetical protein
MQRKELKGKLGSLNRKLESRESPSIAGGGDPQIAKGKAAIPCTPKAPGMNPLHQRCCFSVVLDGATSNIPMDAANVAECMALNGLGQNCGSYTYFTTAGGQNDAGEVGVYEPSEHFDELVDVNMEFSEWTPEGGGMEWVPDGEGGPSVTE